MFKTIRNKLKGLALLLAIGSFSSLHGQAEGYVEWDRKYPDGFYTNYNSLNVDSTIAYVADQFKAKNKKVSFIDIKKKKSIFPDSHYIFDADSFKMILHDGRKDSSVYVFDEDSIPTAVDDGGYHHTPNWIITELKSKNPNSKNRENPTFGYGHFSNYLVDSDGDGVIESFILSCRNLMGYNYGHEVTKDIIVSAFERDPDEMKSGYELEAMIREIEEKWGEDYRRKFWGNKFFGYRQIAMDWIMTIGDSPDEKVKIPPGLFDIVGPYLISLMFTDEDNAPYTYERGRHSLHSHMKAHFYDNGETRPWNDSYDTRRMQREAWDGTYSRLVQRMMNSPKK